MNTLLLCISLFLGIMNAITKGEHPSLIVAQVMTSIFAFMTAPGGA